ncbi:MAG: tetratricopeptide repeat protein [Candidatus Omnitrophota bacterium]
MKVRLAIMVLVFLIISVFAAAARCDDASDARSYFAKANADYAAEKFDEAIADYENALKTGFESSELYYNLGNAYFKSGQLGKAILNYSRAKRFMPNDADLKSNLEYAQSLIKGGAAAAQANWFAHLFLKLTDLFSLDKITLISSILYFILAALIILAIVLSDLRKIIIYAVIAVCILLSISASSLYAQYYRTIVEKEAVVVAQTVDARFEPFDDATVFFSLSEGESVVVVAEREDWVKIKRLDAKQGWIKEADIELL